MHFWAVGLFVRGRSLLGRSPSKPVSPISCGSNRCYFTPSVQGFLTFMSGYTVFLGPFAGIMIADYYIVHRCRVDVPAMYDPHGRYRYTSGIVGLFPFPTCSPHTYSFPVELASSTSDDNGRTTSPPRSHQLH